MYANKLLPLSQPLSYHVTTFECVLLYAQHSQHTILPIRNQYKLSKFISIKPQKIYSNNIKKSMYLLTTTIWYFQKRHFENAVEVRK